MMGYYLVRKRDDRLLLHPTEQLHCHFCLRQRRESVTKDHKLRAILTW